MSLVISIARDEPLCIKASADAAAAWGRNEKGYGFWDRGTIECDDDRTFEITLLVAVRPNANFAEFAKFPSDLQISGQLKDDDAPVGVFAVKQGKATVAIMVPALQSELETNLDEAIELDRVVLATGTSAHLRMIVSIKVFSDSAAQESDLPEDAPLLVQAEIGVAVHGTTHGSGSGGRGARTSETFIEQTTTAIVFAHGAIVRLGETVAPGQILILRHLASKAEAACRVVSVKSNAKAKSFVELDFLQPATGFWGTALRGASAAKSHGADAARAEAAAKIPKAAATAKHVSPAHVARPAAPVSHTAKSGPAAGARLIFSKLPVVPAAIGDAIVGEKWKVAVPEAAPPAPVAAEASIETAAAIEPAPVIPVEPIGEDHAVPPIAAEPAPIEAMRAAPPGEAKRAAQPEEQTVSTPASVAEPDIVSAEETKPEPVAAEEPVVREGDVVGTIAAQAVAIEGMRPAQAGEEVPIEPAAATEIPAATEIAAASPLIEPAAATVTSETIAESKVVEDAAPATAADSARAVAEIAPIAPDAAPIAAPTRVTPTRSVKPKIAAARPASPITSGGEVLSGGAAFAWSKHDQPKQSRAGVIAVAVVVILALAGGVGYYVWQQRIRFDATLGAPSQPILAASAPAPATSPAVSGAIPDPNAPLAASPATAGAQPAATGANSSSVIAPAATQASARNAQPIVNAQSSGAKPRPVSPPNATAQFAPGPEVAEMKMPAPAAAARSTNQTTPDITADVPSGVPSGSTGAFVSDAAQPDRPPPPQAVRTSSGVQQPRLLSAPPPIYPYGARSEHIEGDVSVDLLISETGKVASMTMISGPSLLRQAALDALRQRKYAPAMLDGKPTAAHIVVTIHFQL